MSKELKNGHPEWSRVSQTVPEWFRDAKFGMFFHWGPYSVPACMNEWYSRNMYCKGLEQNKYHEEHFGKLHDFGYKDFIPMMKGEAFDPEAWADLVVRSGARYAGPVTEHADNFSMWDSKVNPINSKNCGPHRDVYGECAKAFRERGIRLLATFHHQWLWGWFMSTDNEADVYDPANEVYYGPALPLETNRYLPYRYPDEAFNTMWRDKIFEVIDKYSPDAIYFDSRTCIIDENYRFQMADYYYNKTGHRDGIITYKQQDFPQEIGVCDLERGCFASPKPFVWQSDDRLEDNVTWCIVQNPKYRSATKIIHSLCDIVSKNGNLLLNVGPCADGSFHPDAVKQLYAVGDWLTLNGEAIYGSRPFTVAAEGPATIDDTNYDVDKLKDQLKNGKEAALKASTLGEHDFRFTTNNGSLYAIAMAWPASGELAIRTLKQGGPLSAISSVELLGCDQPLAWKQTEEALLVTLPEKKPCEHAYVLKIR